MSQPLIVIGDKTDHGGTVISASSTTDIGGKGVARIGDMVACKRCRGVFPISEGDASLIDEGKPVAFHGCKVACGATLIAGQVLAITEPSSGASAIGAASDGAVRAGFGAIGARLLAAYRDDRVEQDQRFRGRFQLLDANSGEPVAGLAVRVRSTGGQHHLVITDAAGFTPWVERTTAEALALDLVKRDAT